MEKRKNKWLIIVILGFSVLAFTGISVVPLFSGILDNNRAQSNSPPTSSVTTPADDQIKQLQEQEKGYRLVLEREPENQTALKGVLEARLQLVAQEKAEVAELLDPLQKLSKLNPEETRYAVLLAQVQEQIGDRESAAQTYRKIIALEPGNVEALQGFVALLVQQGRPAQAADLLENTITDASQTNQLKSGSIDIDAVNLLLGQVYLSQGKFDQSLAIYNTLIEKDDKDFRPVYAKAIVFQQQGKTEEAKPLFESAENLAPANFKDQIKAQANAQPFNPESETVESPNPPTPASGN